MIDIEWLNEDTRVSRATESNIKIPPQLIVMNQKRATLTVVSGFNAGQVFTLEDRETIIGRGREAQIKLEDAGVSRQHSRVVRALDDTYVLEDMGSTNGTFVNGNRIDRAPISPGMQIQIGPNVNLSFTVLDELTERLARQLYESSTRDGLTRAYNRKYFSERLASEVAYSVRHVTKLSVVIFDIDFFKKVNDTHGHLAGDEVLRQVAVTVNRTIRTEDVFARFGGEEFVVLVRGIDHENTTRFAERLRRAVEKTAIAFEDKVLKVTISVGVSSLGEQGEGTASAEDLLLRADERLYRAKHEGRNRVCST